MQAEFSSRSLNASALSRTSVPRQSIRQHPRTNLCSMAAKSYINAAPMPSAPRSALLQPQRAASVAAPATPPRFFEHLFKILAALIVDFSTRRPAPADRNIAVEDRSTIDSLTHELLESRAEAASSQAALDATDRTLELLRVNQDCYKYAMANAYNQLRDRDQGLVSLELRLRKQRSDRRYLDLETDPLIEMQAAAIVRDKRATQLHRENLALLQRMHEMQRQLDAGARACNSPISSSRSAAQA